MKKNQPLDPLAALEFPASSGVVEPRDHTPRGLRNWIAITCGYIGVSPTELAKAAGLAASTVNRFLRTDEGNLSASTIEALLAAARRIEHGSRDNIHDWLHESGTLLCEVPVVGTIAVDQYRSAVELTQVHYNVRIPIRAPFHRFRVVGFEIADDHASPAFPAGTVVASMFLPDQAAVVPRAGDFVTTYRGTKTDDGVVKLEVTVRKLVLSPSGEVWLVSINPDWEIPDLYVGSANNIEFNRLGADQRPTGLIVASIRPILR